MPTARFLISEKRGTWAVAFRRALGGEGPRVYETRSLAECWEELAASPASFLVLELRDDNLLALLQRLVQLQRDYPRACAVVVAGRPLQPYQALVREAGAAQVLFSPRRLAPLVRLAVRHLAAAPREPRSWQQQIWDRLPWGETNQFIRENHDHG